jgi:UDP-N-acetylmuramoyl-L-alanyl-D-glutamate--2,6-diaminopimelate ligase
LTVTVTGRESPMKLSDLTDGLAGSRLEGDGGVEVTGVTTDSRAVRPGDLFVAIRGTAADGHAFVGDAVARGAAAVVVEEGHAPAAVPTVVVGHAPRVLATIASRYFGDPSSRLTLCGVTGTNGKTSTAHILRAIVDASRLGKMGIVGTLGHGVDSLTSTPHTTPDAVTLHRLLRGMVDQECFGVVMEVSSHAVRQHRTWGLDFEVGILTNVTHDHLDYHRDLADYRAAKSEFCDSLIAPGRAKPDGTLVYYRDDAVAREIGEAFAGHGVSVGSGGDADVEIVQADASLDGTRVELGLQDGAIVRVRMKLLGTFVAANAALAAAAAVELGVDADAVREGLESIERVDGRFETLGGGGRPLVVIDYSHTPDAVDRVLSTCRSLGGDRLITVFGCGGDRDRSKRPLIAAAVQRHSDRSIVTTDNPRSESIDAIVEDILSGMERDAGDVTVELDRAAAVAAAITSAGPRDVVALLGKGHEPYQVIGDARLPYNERDEAKRGLDAWRGGGRT